MIKLRITTQKAVELMRSPRGESIRYIIIGGCTTFVDYASFYLMDTLLHIDVSVSNVTSTIFAILFAYVTNKFYVFRSRTASLQELAAEFFKFIAARLATMVIEVGGVYLFVNLFGQNDNLGKAETIVIVIIINYFLSKFIVFRRSRQTRHN